MDPEDDQEQDLQQKVLLQQQLLETQKHRQFLELGRAQNAMLEAEKSGSLMDQDVMFQKARQQQQLLEAENQIKIMEQQRDQQQMMAAQQKAMEIHQEIGRSQAPGFPPPLMQQSQGVPPPMLGSSRAAPQQHSIQPLMASQGSRSMMGGPPARPFMSEGVSQKFSGDGPPGRMFTSDMDNVPHQFTPEGGPPRQFMSESGPPRHFMSEGGQQRQFAHEGAPPRQFSKEGGPPRQFTPEGGAPRQFNQEGAPSRQFQLEGGPPRQFAPESSPPAQFTGDSGPPRQFNQEGRQEGPPAPRPLMSENVQHASLRPPQKSDDTPPPQKVEEEKPSGPQEIRLPHALEKVLAFKDVRAQQVGVDPEEIDVINQEVIETAIEESAELEEEEVKVAQQPKKKEPKNKKKKKKKKKAKHSGGNQVAPVVVQDEPDDDIEIEYVPEQLDLNFRDPMFSQFAKVFDAFKITEKEKPREAEKKEEEKPEKKVEPDPMPADDDDDSDDDPVEKPPEDDKPKLSKKKMKKLNRLSVAELKQLVTRPDVVEMHDVTAQDPKLLVHLKATRNTVPVPRHWCFKRKYLQGKRGIEKPPFELPEYIQATGIQEMRATLQEKEDQKSLKQKMRERVRPKMGKIDIDYQKLHDAFFKWQTKPKMSIHGDLYYEGKEFETRLKEKKPGNLTDELRTALGMPLGPNSEKFPPPWLIAMQRYGPPPSYPNLKIPGLNAPIPESCAFGYHAGGWGKPPVDESGKPLYGDVFGTQATSTEEPVQDDDIDRTHWGELESESESEEEESDESSEGEMDNTGLITPGTEGLITPSGVTSIPMGMETPDMIELRKRRIEDAMDQGGDTPALFTVIPEKKAGSVGGAMMGSAHIYDVSGVKKTGEKGPAEGIEVALNPEELDLDAAAMQAKYDQTVREQQSQLEKEDLSDMVAEHAAKQQKKRKKQQQEGKSSKKYKEFKF